ncbi:MAG: ChrR family anti-sigma-E factor [Ferrovibrio sp.]|uniref:ChrR family anti-sigma-E factor n=1 Tax=Ferrovibrio sp. TaxID=1917215 RepID=UPI0026042EF0|nr:ChrR family anti-sigma-E factor [Ferrovibrio sp.]MCW0233492.1 ChrR family anti-sigma-E factor [Ferrovibrio sp.]
MAVTDLAAYPDSPRGSMQGPAHHIPAELLLDYATGTLAEPWSLVVACHLTLCPHCRRELAAIEATAGAMLEEIAPQPVSAGGFAAVAARLGPQDAAPAVRAPAKDGLPAPLRDYLATGIDAIRWRWSGAGLQSHALPMRKTSGGMVSLLRVAPGAGLPMHTHAGNEMTLVLSGGYTAGNDAFRRGDVEIADGSIEHRPVAMADGPCICLAVTDAPLRFSGSFGWLLNQWARLSA